MTAVVSVDSDEELVEHLAYVGEKIFEAMPEELQDPT